MTKPTPKAPAHTKRKQANVPPTAKPPAGKLGSILKRVEAKTGATLNELREATGWQPHTVRGALSRLRARGFAILRHVEGGRSSYRLAGIRE